MMDMDCIESIAKFILQSNMSDFNINQIEQRPIVCEISKTGDMTHTVNLSFGVTMCREKAALSEAWVAGNILLFTIFDGYLENKYNLIEGESFRNHYNNLPENTLLEKISKNCYRILKLIRNAIQHNLSNVVYSDGNYDINYHYGNTLFKLQISSNGVRNLYTLILNIVQGKIMGSYEKYTTNGHYEGIMYTLYAEMIKCITNLSDDFGSNLLDVSGGIKLRAIVRYPVENPIIISEDENAIIFVHIETNGTDDESSNQYRYSTDYVYKDFILPQEIGVITVDKRENYTSIRFDKKHLKDRWKIRKTNKITKELLIET